MDLESQLTTKMAAGGEDDIEAKITDMNIAERKQHAGVLKTRFTRQEKGAAHAMDLWSANIEEPAIAKRTKKLMEGLRNDHENVMRAYDMILGSLRMTEELFQTD